MVVLAILGSCLAPLRHLEEALATELAADLVSIITRVHHVQVRWRGWRVQGGGVGAGAGNGGGGVSCRERRSKFWLGFWCRHGWKPLDWSRLNAVTYLPLLHPQAVSVAGQCLCTLARILPAHKAGVREQAAQYFLLLEGDYLKKVRREGWGLGLGMGMVGCEMSM